MLLGFGSWGVLLVRQSYVPFFLDKKVLKKSRLCIVFNADWAAKNLNCSNSPWCSVDALDGWNCIGLCFQADR